MEESSTMDTVAIAVYCAALRHHQGLCLKNNLVPVTDPKASSASPYRRTAAKKLSKTQVHGLEGSVDNDGK
eukprot:3750912-Amphidinium_carterae.1